MESQHQIATRKLVGSEAEQRLLEEMIDSVKPPLRAGAALHYLLFTPFRYPPLQHGSRFGTRVERGIWYGSESRSTVFAEVAYYRLLFLEGTAAALEPLEAHLTVFRILVRTPRGIDLLSDQFRRFADLIASPASYAATQLLGREMRESRVEALRYPSARDAGGVNVAVLDPAAFGRRQPRALEIWHCTATRESVEFGSRDYFRRSAHRFEREQFLVGGRLPAPAP